MLIVEKEKDESVTEKRKVPLERGLLSTAGVAEQE